MKHTFRSMKCTFHSMKYNFPLREGTFFPRGAILFSPRDDDFDLAADSFVSCPQFISELLTELLRNLFGQAEEKQVLCVFMTEQR